jgi:hypothetical protein
MATRNISARVSEFLGYLKEVPPFDEDQELKEAKYQDISSKRLAEVYGSLSL